MTEQTPSTSNITRRTTQLSGVQITFAMIVAFGLILAINFSGRIAASQPLEAVYSGVQTEIAALEREQATLVAQRDFSQSDAYVEQWSRSEGKMVREGEVLVVPVPANRGVQPTPVPMPTIPVQTSAPQPDNWMQWWALFFDAPPPDLNRR
jgi:cell division protein FtsB